MMIGDGVSLYCRYKIIDKIRYRNEHTNKTNLSNSTTDIQIKFVRGFVFVCLYVSVIHYFLVHTQLLDHSVGVTRYAFSFSF